MPPLFDPARHEPLRADPWSEVDARAWITRIAEDADARFSQNALWPAHPLDLDGEPASERFTSLYFGAAGVIWALDALAHAGLRSSRRDFRPVMAPLAERNRAEVERMGWGSESLLMGQCGVALLAWRLSPDGARADRIAGCVERNARHPSNEFLWGAPGTLHAALAMHEATGEQRWADLFTAGASSLRATFEFDGRVGCRMWTQDLYGERVRYIGAGHGFAGNAGVVVRGMHLLDGESQHRWIDDLVRTVERTAIRDGAYLNWPPIVESRPHKMLVQWCHGAPGMITSLAALRDARLDAPLLDGGELVWHAGPLAKVGGLCHGTGGNGFAFLKLHRRSGDARWLERARAFAMHAMAQCDRDAKRYGQRRYSLWTGDPGVALYVAACIEGDDELPLIDPRPR